MPFRLSNDGDNWFKDIKDSGFQVDFDSFYFCFMAGITAGRKKKLRDKETRELVDYFPDKYSKRGRLIVALF